jgi:ParB family chromosome partitioning protein
MATFQADLPLAALFVSSLNTRRDLTAGQEDSGIDDLASSIREKGLLQPITVRPAPDGRYEVVVGQRRFLACQKAGYDPIPCRIRDDLDDTDAVTLSLVENVHRADMNPLDKARALKSLYDRHQSYARVAKETSWSEKTIRRYIALLELPPSIQDKINTSQGPAGVGALARLASIFSGEEAAGVYEKISGFKQNIQEEILKRSGGDAAKIDELVEEAMEGAFDVRRCGGRFKCEVIRDLLGGKLEMRDFENLVKDVTETVGAEVGRGALKEAARSFWKTLATGQGSA